MGVTQGITAPEFYSCRYQDVPTERYSWKAVYRLIPASAITFPLPSLTETDLKAEVGTAEKTA